MSVSANIGGTWKAGTLWQNVGGTWRKVVPWLNVAGSWKKDAVAAGQALAATASPDYVSGAVSRPSGGPVGTNATTVNVTGGTAPYTCAWGNQTGWTINSPSGATTAFSHPAGSGQQFTQDFTCTVTDARNATTSVVVTADVSNYYSGGGGGVIQ